MRILVCGDSFAITDPNFPGLHWTDKILDHSADFEVCNLAAGGASNAMIALQLMQGLQLRPDFVIFSFIISPFFDGICNNSPEMVIPVFTIVLFMRF